MIRNTWSNNNNTTTTNINNNNNANANNNNSGSSRLRKRNENNNTMPYKDEQHNHLNDMTLDRDLKSTATAYIGMERKAAGLDKSTAGNMRHFGRYIGNKLKKKSVDITNKVEKENCCMTPPPGMIEGLYQNEDKPSKRNIRIGNRKTRNVNLIFKI